MRIVPKHVTDLQRKASDPATSVWVSANAGSGKTHVLAQRVLRLLLDGVPPAKILCLTFTKAAAANMAERVFKSLSDWTAHDDASLAKTLAEIGAPKVDAGTLTFARRLFARTVETPGGLKIHTIHGFCERLLHLFPFEANVPGRFDVLDELGEAELLALARREALAEAEKDKGALGTALKTLAAETSQDEFTGLLKEALRHREHLRHYDADEAGRDLGTALDIPHGTSIVSVEADMIDGGIGPARWPDFADFLAMGSPSDIKLANLFREAVAAHRQGERGNCLAAYFEIFFTDHGAGKVRDKLATKKLVELRPGLVDELFLEQQRLEGLRDLRKAVECREKSLALTTLVAAVFTRYEALKAMRGKLDFDDLIDRTLALFERSDARWVLYKLDSGIDHILVDEAQDTSPAQWRILEHLASEFFAGAGSRSQMRTFFAVGDEKQSIFSFQGAAPDMFHAMRARFARKFTAAQKSFAHVPLKASFRSVPAVIEAVDRVFDFAAHQRGLVSDDRWMGHDSLKETLPGLIEIWQPVTAAERPETGDWRLPLDLLDESDPANLLAQRIAKKIAALIAPGSGEIVYDAKHARFRAVTPGDILILVRTRNALFDAIIRALKQTRVPVAGADRLDLLAHIAVMDLIAAGRTALLPQDDLTLAAMLKSPLIGFDDEDLLRLAPNREGSLFAALGHSDAAKDKAAHQTILSWRARAAGTAFDFYARLLAEDGGRRAMEARLGPEACDAMDEFLRLALRAEKDGARSLPSFLAEIESLDLSIKRDMESAADAVRVMTVHAAKGLEAKIVFLPDTCGAPRPQHDAKIHLLDGARNRKILAWSPRKDDDPAAVARARQAARDEAENEYRRLLYVAMTRAEERLYVSGFYRRTEPSALCWGAMIDATRGDAFVEVPAFWDAAEKVWRYAAPGEITQVDADAVRAAPPEINLPDWLSTRAPAEASPTPPLRPSNTLAAGEPEIPLPGSARHAALERGRLIHTLLQYLPEVEAEQRPAAAGAFLQARAPDLDESACGALIEQVLSMLDSPELAGLFGPRARAEVALAGIVTLPNGKTRDVLGRLDRIAESETEVLVADFKTGAPAGAESTPAGYLRQMALYRAVLAPLWPGKSLRMLLIWTEGPKVVELSAAQLDRALTGLL